MLPRLRAESVICSHSPWRPGYELSVLHAQELSSVSYKLTLHDASVFCLRAIVCVPAAANHVVLVVNSGCSVAGPAWGFKERLNGVAQCIEAPPGRSAANSFGCYTQCIYMTLFGSTPGKSKSYLYVLNNTHTSSRRLLSLITLCTRLPQAAPDTYKQTALTSTPTLWHGPLFLCMFSGLC